MPARTHSIQGCAIASDGRLASRYLPKGNIPNKISVLRQPLESARYAHITFSEHLGIEGIRSLIGTVADAYGGTLMEPMMGLFKTECIRTTVFDDGRYRNFADVEWATAGWVDWWNNRHLGSSFEYRTTVECERS